MDTSLRDILTAVREGRLDPAAAATLLAEAPSMPSATADPDVAVTDEPEPGTSDDVPSGTAWAGATDDLAGPTPDPHASTPDEPAAAALPPRPRASTQDQRDASATTTLRVRAMTRKVKITGDRTVATVSIDGPHELRRDGSVLVCEVDRDLGFGDPFAFLPSGFGRFRLQPHGKPFSLGAELEIRVNPDLDLDVDVTAGSLQVAGVGRVRAKITAGSARLDDVGPLDLHVVGGTARIETVMTGSDNKIRCDSGSIVVRLRPGSDVRLRTEAQLGRVVVNGVEGAKDVGVGAGTGRLRSEVVMGSIQIDSAP